MRAVLFILLLADTGISEHVRCTEKEALADAAAFAALSADVERLAEANGLGEKRAAAPTQASPPPALEKVLADLARLRARKCFALSAENPRWKAPATVEALVEWWRAGGGDWLASYVHGGDRVILPPDVRNALVLDGSAKHPLAPILCKSADAGCGAETKGWVRRAEEALRLHAVDNGRLAPTRGSAAPAPDEGCARTDYRAWRTCLEERRETRPMLPLGRFRAPEGWFVVRGRRGHYAFCDELRAYDLSTGAAWVAQSCSDLVLTGTGSVDGAATDAKRGITARAGTVPADAIREAAWMTLLAGEVEERVQPYARHVSLPPGLEPRWPAGLGVMSSIGLDFWMTSAQTRLRWAWFRLGRLQHAGEVTWPDSSDAGESHAADLLRIAEDGFRDGCPPATPPRELFAFTSGAKVSAIDASPESVRGAQDALVEALRSLRPCE